MVFLDSQNMKITESKMLVKSSNNELGQEEVESLGMAVLEESWPTFLLLFFILLKILAFTNEFNAF